MLLHGQGLLRSIIIPAKLSVKILGLAVSLTLELDKLEPDCIQIEDTQFNYL